MLDKRSLDQIGEYLRHGKNFDLPETQNLIREYKALTSQTAKKAVAEIAPRFPEEEVRGRAKTIKTTRAKLLRSSYLSLSTIDDLVGVRISGDFTLHRQNQIVDELTNSFTVSKIRDRRVTPVNGYRAVHVITRFDLFRVEIQVRTVLQNEWAGHFEFLAKVWGEQIKYGLPPRGSQVFDRSIRQQLIDRSISFSLIDIAQYEQENFASHDDSSATKQMLRSGIIEMSDLAKWM
jgi:hypothetical protein